MRHAGIATISALLLCRRTSFSIGALRWWTVAGAAVGELLVRADNTALMILLEADQREVGLAGALVPPIAGAIGAVVASGRVDAIVAERLSRDA